MPNMICLCGMPGVGKTTWAKKFLENHSNYVYFNPDQYYAFFNGDNTIRENTFEVWMSMFRDINTAMKDGKNVLIDSDNLSFHQRMQWIEWFPDFDHILVFFEAPWDVCYSQMQQRRRKLTYDQMIIKWNRWERPTTEKDGKFWKHIFIGRHSSKYTN